jgi:hypothetical protein
MLEGFGPLQVGLGTPADSVLPEVPHEGVLSAFSWLRGESIRHYQDLECTISQRQLSEGGGAYAKL